MATAAKDRQLDATVFSPNLSAVSLKEDFRIRRNRGGPWVDLGGVVTDCQWTDSAGPDASPVVEGSLSAILPEGHLVGASPMLRDGDQVRLDVFWAGKWREVWTTRVYEPEATTDNSFSCTLYDDLYLLQQTKTQMDFVKNKGRKKGWRAHEIVRALSERYRFPVGSIVRGTRYSSLRAPADANLLDIIRLAYKRESEHTGRDYYVSWRNGKLSVLPVSTKNTPWHFSVHVQSASYAETRSESFCTSLLMRCTIKENGKKVKVKMRVMNEKAITRYGYIEKSKVAKTPDNRPELKRMGQHLLARRMVPKRTVSFEHPGVALIKAGEAARLTIEELGIRRTQRTKEKQDQGLIILEQISHSLSAGSYSMSVTCRFDPFATRADIIHGDHEARVKKAKERAKKK